MDWVIFLIFCWLLDLCNDMVKAGHSGQAALLATVITIAGLFYIRFIREYSQRCQRCNSGDFVTLRKDTVQNLLDSVHDTEYHKDEVVVDETLFENLRGEFDKQGK